MVFAPSFAFSSQPRMATPAIIATRTSLLMPFNLLLMHICVGALLCSADYFTTRGTDFNWISCTISHIHASRVSKQLIFWIFSALQPAERIFSQTRYISESFGIKAAHKAHRARAADNVNIIVHLQMSKQTERAAVGKHFLSCNMIHRASAGGERGSRAPDAKFN